ncbi:NADH:flavin oxidoreductase [Chloroflexia bacterium SDU3-3]|nr:NADH:flavin oxidoreductase [Chloroflexia bacterium SDU3-3]
MLVYDNLFTPLPLGRGGVALPNRLVMGPMTLNQASESGHLTPWIFDWYRRRAEGGVGTIIGAAAAVSANGRGWGNAMAIYDDSHIEGWAKAVEIAHASGALFGTQIFHAGAASHNALLGHQPIAPSAWTRKGFDPARPMTEGEIEQVIEDFAEAARRSIEAGSDFVEIHGAHQYLIHQFWQANVNERTDAWGDPLAFPVAVTKAVRAAIGSQVPLLYRFSIHADDPASPNKPVTTQGLGALLQSLEEAGVDVWDISCFHESRRGYFGTPRLLPDWVRHFSQKPRIVAGNLLTPDDASSYIAEGHAEAAALARALIADADWARKARSNEAEGIRPYQNQHWDDLTKGIDPTTA